MNDGADIYRDNDVCDDVDGCGNSCLAAMKQCSRPRGVAQLATGALTLNITRKRQIKLHSVTLFGFNLIWRFLQFYLTRRQTTILKTDKQFIHQKPSSKLINQVRL